MRFTVENKIFLDGEVITYVVIRKRIKNAYFRFTDGKIVVSVNYLVSDKKIEKMLHDNAKAILKLQDRVKQRSEEKLSYLGNDLDLNAKMMRRKKDFVVYIKGAEHISDFLAAIGSNKGILEFEQIRVIKDVKNRVNRINNFENANLEKTIDTALLQIEDIMLIKRNRKFQKMPQKQQNFENI